MKINFIEWWSFDSVFSTAFFSNVHLDLVNSKLTIHLFWSRTSLFWCNSELRSRDEREPVSLLVYTSLHKSSSGLEWKRGGISGPGSVVAYLVLVLWWHF